MFDFLFWRSGKRKNTYPAEITQPSERIAQREDARQEANRQAEAVSSDESAAVHFILNCPYADARLKAAEGISSPHALEQVRNAMRNVDRRVAKLMQARLDIIRQREESEQAADACIDAARRLVQEPHLTPSQVADLDRNWQALSDVAPHLQRAFELVRRDIADRLAAQTALQRKVMDALARMKQISNAPESFAANELEQMLDSLAAEITECAGSPELPSLPRNLLPEFEEQYRKLKALQDAYELRVRAIEERSVALSQWESLTVDNLDRKQMEGQWRALPHLQESDLAPLQIRFDALLRAIAKRDKDLGSPKQAQPVDEKRIAFTDALAVMEKALREGALQLAAEQDEMLRSLSTDAGRIGNALMGRLSHARSELKRLQDWARWGGIVSREELIRMVEALPSLALPLDELANRVAESRKTWKSLDVASGPAPKALWEQFDTACKAAYAPVAEHGRKQAEERERNAETAQTLIAQVNEFVQKANLAQSEVDWKHAAAFYRRMRQSWRQLGTIDRQERKRLNTEFEQAILALQQPLEQQWQAEIAHREQLIETVLALDPKHRGSAEAVRRMQQQWRESARNLPLNSSEEQALWKRFREACDGMFAQRKEAAESADVARKHVLAAKESLCERLEAELDKPAEEIPGILAKAASEWSRLGSEPSTDQDVAVQKRYRAAVTALKARMDAADADARLANCHTMIEKLMLCQAAESAIAAGMTPDMSGWQLHWQVLPSLSHPQETLLRSRFDAALAALESGDSQYASLLQANRVQLLDELLRLEILFGFDSPEEFARQRLKMQVEILQESFDGSKESAEKAHLDIVCSLPALTDEQSMKRMAAILQAAA